MHTWVTCILERLGMERDTATVADGEIQDRVIKPYRYALACHTAKICPAGNPAACPWMTDHVDCAHVTSEMWSILFQGQSVKPAAAVVRQGVARRMLLIPVPDALREISECLGHDAAEQFITTCTALAARGIKVRFTPYDPRERMEGDDLFREATKKV